MNGSKFLNYLIARLAIGALTLSGATPVLGACDAPRYEIARTWEDGPTSLDLFISIRLEDFAPKRLICLAEATREKYPERNITLGIFSDNAAAKSYVPGSSERTPQTVYNESKLHGFYVYNREKHEDYILILPDGNVQDVESPFNTRIDLPASNPPGCRISVRDRCLLELEHIYPPSYDAGRGASGQVTVTGRIDGDGSVSNVVAIDVKGDPPQRQTALADFAIRNLRSWHFEVGPREDDLRITYRFDIHDYDLTDSPRPRGRVQINLPEEVKIEGVRVRSGR